MSEEHQIVVAAIARWKPEASQRFETLIGEFVDPAVLVPEVVEYRGCLLNKRVLSNPHLDQWFEDRFSDQQREYVLNHLHLWDVTWIDSNQSKDDKVMQRLREFLPVLAEFWRQEVSRQTTLPFEVWTADDPEEYGPTIGFGLVR